MSEYFQRVSYFDVVVDFAVKYNSEIAILGKNRLVSGIQVDNFQARRARREKTGLKDALLIRPPVNQRRGCLAYSLRRRAPIFSRESNDSAQLFVPHGAPFERQGALQSP